MKLNLDKIKNNPKITVLLLLSFCVFVGLSCLSATDIDKNLSLNDSADDAYIDSLNSIDDVDLELDDNATDEEIDNDTYPNDSSNSGLILDEDGNFKMELRGESGSTGYQWKISSETYGVDVLEDRFVPDYSRLPENLRPIGGGGTHYFTFHVNDDCDGHYYVKLILVRPNGEIAKVVDSNMIN